jgi:hypothetical protein
MNIIEKINNYRLIDKEYSNTLFTALVIIGEDQLTSLLNDAEKQGRRLKLTFPLPFEIGPSDPNGVI